jgi:glycosyltransferase involved in cell wall biosynthesis
MRDCLRELGLRSEVFAEIVHRDLRNQGRALDEYPRNDAGSSGVLYHLAIDSPAEVAFRTLPEPRGVVYHNLTPARFFRPVSRLNYERVRDARRALPALAEVAELGIGVSEYNRAELEAAGFRRTATCPITITPPSRRFARAPLPATVLAVGRVAPHKRLELAIEAVAALRRDVPTARLELVGNDEEMEPYSTSLRRLAARLNAGVHFLGKVSEQELEAAYARATTLLLTSAHEGFGLPVVEAMAREVPVVATRHGAIPETAEGAALLCGDDPIEIAAALQRMITDSTLRRVLVERGRRRAADFSRDVLRDGLATALAPWGVVSP